MGNNSFEKGPLAAAQRISDNQMEALKNATELQQLEQGGGLPIYSPLFVEMGLRRVEAGDYSLLDFRKSLARGLINSLVLQLGIKLCREAVERVAPNLLVSTQLEGLLFSVVLDLESGRECNLFGVVTIPSSEPFLLMLPDVTEAEVLTRYEA